MSPSIRPYFFDNSNLLKSISSAFHFGMCRKSLSGHGLRRYVIRGISAFFIDLLLTSP